MIISSKWWYMSLFLTSCNFFHLVSGCMVSVVFILGDLGEGIGYELS